MKDFFLGLNGFDNRRLLWINRLIVFLALIFSFNEVYAKYFTQKPARSCAAVKQLPKNVLCELDVIACLY